jgi:hypothetical protein
VERVAALNIDVLTGAVNPMPNVIDKGDEYLHVEFEMYSHYDDCQTREQGRAIFRMEEYVKIAVPGDVGSLIHRPVRESDKTRWPKQYAAFLAGKVQNSDGTPLSEWAQISRAQVDELAFFKLTTIEQLANASDTVCQKFTGLVTLKEKAKVYLEKMRGEQPELRLQAEVAKQKEENEAMRARMASLESIIAEMASKAQIEKAPEKRKSA